MGGKIARDQRAPNQDATRDVHERVRSNKGGARGYRQSQERKERVEEEKERNGKEFR